jgi:signal peptidase complex subunit 2
VPIYNVKVTMTSKNGKTDTLEFSRPFNEWFDSAGHFIATPFQTVFATAVPLIAKADPKRVEVAAPVPSTSAPVSTPASVPAMDSSFINVDASMLDALAASASSGADGAASSGKKSKRRKA